MELTTTALTGDRLPRRPLLVVGPSLGTSVARLWGETAALLADRHDVVGWDLPGHGRSAPATSAFTVADLARAAVTAVDGVLAKRGESGAAYRYAGVSVGGAVGQQLLVDHADRITAATLIATGTTIATPDTWSDRASLVRTEGMAAVVAGSAERWFAPGSRDTAIARALLDDLEHRVDAESYALACGALGSHDLRGRLGAVTVPVVAIAGGHDPICRPDALREIADTTNGRLVVLDDAGHLPPAEQPDAVAQAIGATDADAHSAGLAVRRAVLGADHVDRAATSGLAADFQRFITEYAWGGIWTRPGLDRKSRSLITLTALVALGHDEELALHLRAARTNGLTDDEIVECLLQTAIYCGVPAANRAFRVAEQVLGE